jgi:ribonucleoside-diphosphate reductase alpha chain
VKAGHLNAVSNGGMSALDAAAAAARQQIAEAGDAPVSGIKQCLIDDPTCEACQ